MVATVVQALGRAVSRATVRRSRVPVTAGPNFQRKRILWNASGGTFFMANPRAPVRIISNNFITTVIPVYCNGAVLEGYTGSVSIDGGVSWGATIYPFGSVPERVAATRSLVATATGGDGKIYTHDEYYRNTLLLRSARPVGCNATPSVVVVGNTVYAVECDTTGGAPAAGGIWSYAPSGATQIFAIDVVNRLGRLAKTETNALYFCSLVGGATISFYRIQANAVTLLFSTPLVTNPNPFAWTFIATDSFLCFADASGLAGMYSLKNGQLDLYPSAVNVANIAFNGVEYVFYEGAVRSFLLTENAVDWEVVNAGSSFFGGAPLVLP